MSASSHGRFTRLRAPFVESAGGAYSWREGLEALDGLFSWFDRGDEPSEHSTMDWAADYVFADADEPPVAVVDEGAVGKEAMIRVVGATPADVADTVGRPDAVARGATE